MSLQAAAERNLRWLLRDLAPILSDPALTDLHIQGPGEGFVDRGRGYEHVELPFTFEDLDAIAINAAAANGAQDVAEDAPLAAGRFPGGMRVQICRPPVTAEGTVALSVRQPKASAGTPDDLARSGVFTTPARPRTVQRNTLADLHASRAWQPLLELAVQSGLSVVFSGTVGSGKTHNMRAFARCIPLAERIVTVEDMHELLGLPHPNRVHLFYSKGRQSVANVSAGDLVEAAMRMGMDWLLVQELRDGEGAMAYVNVLRSGHCGMTTTHADSAADALHRIAGLLKDSEAGRFQDEGNILATLRRSIDVIAHCVRDGNHRYVEDVWLAPAHRGEGGE